MSRARRAAPAGLALCLLLAAAGLRAQEPGSPSRDLERLREAIEESRDRVAAYEREERGLLEALDAIETSAALLERDVVRARSHAREARKELGESERRAAGVAEDLADLERAMSKRAVALYRAGELGAVPLLFSAGDLRDFLSRVQTLRRLLRHDASLLAVYRETKTALEAAREVARLAAEESQRAQQMLDQRSAELRREREAKRRLARQLRGSRARERRALAELETAAQALEEAVSALPEQELASPAGSPQVAFASLRGSLEPPVARGSVSKDFGRVVDSEFLTETFRKGVEYAVPTGTPVRAVADGRVRFAGRFRGYGNTVILDHGDQYFTVSAHLSELRVGVGDWVDAGAEIGRSGESGSLTGPQLYFEVRRGGTALDPREWLRDEG